MAKINVSVEGYYDIAVNAGTMSQLTDQIKTNFLAFKNNDSVQTVLSNCELTSSINTAEGLLDSIIYRANRMYEVMSYLYYVYSETENNGKTIALNVAELSTENIELLTDDVFVDSQVERSINKDTVEVSPENKESVITSDSGSNMVSYNDDISKKHHEAYNVIQGISLGSKLIKFILTPTLKGLKFKPKDIYTIVSGKIRDIPGCGTRYKTTTLLDGDSSVCQIFKRSKVKDGFSIIGDATDILITGYECYLQIDEIWNNDGLTNREKQINTAGVGITTAIGIALDVASIACTCSGVAAPIGVALSLIKMAVTSDSGLAATTATVEAVVESCDQIKDSVSKAYATGVIDMGAINENFDNAIGDAVRTGGDIIESAWNDFWESDGLLDGAGNLINLVCAPAMAMTEVVVNSVVAVGTAVVNTVASAGAAVISWFKKW